MGSERGQLAGKTTSILRSRVAMWIISVLRGRRRVPPDSRAATGDATGDLVSSALRHGQYSAVADKTPGGANASERNWGRTRRYD